MSGDAEIEAPRPRPLSGGLWTLFSWLRRDEHSSSESLSSAGSDRTAASFAFLAPAHYGRAAPAPLPPPPPPTDSYKKRVRDRNVRRQHDRDITLHRKYGLYGYGYDTFSLPCARSAAGDRCERDRRAASECPRAHVPGKRRAPPPPAPASLPRRRARKRPAPLPPVNPNKENNCNLEPMDRQPLRDKRPPQNQDNVMDCKPEKHSKKDAQTKETKDIKIRHEKSFLKQIFDNRKRNSAIETSSVKLPSISELDKQAAEIIEKYRLKELVQNDASEKELEKNEPPGSSKQQIEAWICTRCLRKYNSSVITCDYCLPLNKSLNDSYKSTKVSNNCTQTNNNLSNSTPGSSSGRVEEEKVKLKEMLKEMKDSLPKRPKNDLSAAVKLKNTSELETKEDYSNIVEAPTLRIGSTICMDKNLVAQTSSANHFNPEASSSELVSQDMNIPNKEALTTINSVIITQPVVLVHTKQSNVVLNESKANIGHIDKILPVKNDLTKSSRDSSNENIVQIEKIIPTNDPKALKIISKTIYDLNTPLKISSLLNPIYKPKRTSTTNTQTPNLVKQTANIKEIKTQPATTSSEPLANAAENVINFAVPSISQIKPINTNLLLNRKDKLISEPKTNVENDVYEDNNRKIINTKIKPNDNLVIGPASNTKGPSSRDDGDIDHHARRRDLINQLERSIAKGDEHAAADAAVKLAQLRLSCSVLSYSSQIVAEASTSSPTTPQQIHISNSVNDTKNKKVVEVVQKSSQTTINPVKAATPNESAEKIIVENDNNPNHKEKPILTKKEDLRINNTAKSDNSVLPKLEYVNKTKSSFERRDAVLQNSVSCEASTSKCCASKKDSQEEEVPILVWVEDKDTTRGPVQLHVRRDAVMGELRGKAEQSLGLVARMQRWIVGRTLCSDDSTPLVSLAGPELSAPFYLCLVESDTKDAAKPQIELKINEDLGNVYNELMKLERQALVSNAEAFECGVCIEECLPGGGVVLRECVHSFCKECLSDVVRHSEEPVVSCPAMGCRGVLQEREIRGLVSPDDYEKWLARGLAAAESGTRNAFHCRTRDCTGWALCDPGVRRFPCPVCKRTNCVPCQAIHEGETCQQYRVKLKECAASPGESQTDEGTRALLNTLISRGEALECPECSAIITKKWGCDWVKCSACKTEICWVTKGRRWGPAGRGDTSGGCRCGVEGKRCHPSCGYCH